MSTQRLQRCRSIVQLRLLRGTALVPAAALAGSSSVLAQAVNLGHAAGGPGTHAGPPAIQGTFGSVRSSTYAGGSPAAASSATAGAMAAGSGAAGRAASAARQSAGTHGGGRSGGRSGGIAVETVSSFNDPAGSTVNLRVPHGAKELVIVVENGAVNIQGTVNAFKRGGGGANIVFVDPQGLVLGGTGKVNAGSVSVVTPSGATLSQLVDSKGRVRKELAAKVLAGNVPLSSDGSVVIQGGINAAHAVRVTAQDVHVAGSLAEAQRMAAQKARFESTVNTQGMHEGSTIVAGNGSLRIVGTGEGKGGSPAVAGVAPTATSLASLAHRGHGSATLVADRGRPVAPVLPVVKPAASGLAYAGAPAQRSGETHAARQENRQAGSARTSDQASTILIDAGGDVSISGLLSVASTPTQAGSITITGKDVGIAATARLIAEGTGAADGGTITIKARGTTTVAAGATFDAAAFGTGNGGTLEISGAVDRVATAINVALGAANGRAGTLLFDPDQLIIGGNAPGASGSLYTNGSSVELDATTSIEIAGTIDTRQYGSGQVSSQTAVAGLLAANNKTSTGDSGSITLKAPSITVDAGGALYADVGGTSHKAGDVALVATATDNEVVGASAASTGITINGTITGANVSATAIATASSSIETLAGFIQAPVNTAAGSLLGLDGSYVGSSATAKVTLQANANLQASGTVQLISIGSETANDPIVTLASVIPQNPVSVGVVIGKISGTVATEVQSGATISAGGAVTVAAANTAAMSVNAQTITFNPGTSADATVAYSTGSVATKALIDSGASITKASSLAVTAQNTNSFSTEAGVLAGGPAQAGVAVAISDVSTSSTAILGASLASNAGVGAISVYSGSNTTANVVQASTTVGSSFLTVGFSTAAQNFFAPATTFFGSGGALGSTGAGAAMSAQGTGSFVPKGGAALSLNLSQQTSAASIAATGGAAAPTITATGDVAVVSRLTDAGIRSDAEATINSNSYNPTTNDPGASSSLALAVSVAQITHESDASIGAKVVLTAAHVGVDAELSMPITNSWTNYATFGQVTGNLEQLGSQLNGNGGVVNDILSSYANATSSSSNLGLAGAVDYFAITNTTTASIGAAAQVTQTSATPTWTSGISVANGADGSGAVQNAVQAIGWTAGVAVTASTSTQSIDVGGNFNWLLVLGGSNSTSPLGNAVGGSANVDLFATTTTATIGSGAVVTAPGNVDVAAVSSDLVYGVAPTSGIGSGFGGNGIASVVRIDNTTAASISNTATVTAPSVGVNAEQDLSGFAVAGAVGASSGSGVGIAVALQDIETNTSAFIGDSALNASQTGTSGGIDTNALTLAALTTGRLTTVSVAAQYSNGTPPVAAPDSVGNMSPSTSRYFFFISEFLANGSALATKLGSAISTAGAANPNAGAGTNSVAGAGSSSVALTGITTVASLENGRVSPYATGGTGNSVGVQALDNMTIDTASGAAAIAKGAPLGNYTVGIAGAVAVAIDADHTAAAIGAGSTITADTVAVQALAGGENTAVGLAVALTASTGISSATAVSASVSVVQINDGVNASIDSSSLAGTAAGNAGAVSVSAVDNTAIGIGAGSLAVQGAFFGNGSSIGIALTYAGIGDPTAGAGVSAIVSNSALSKYGALSVEALDQDRIISGAAVASGGATSNGFAGAVVINQIAPTVLAEITGTPAVSGAALNTTGITVSGDVNVTASGGTDATLDGLISTARISPAGGLASSGGGTGVDDSHLDFTASQLSPATSAGAGIFAVAGQVGVGKSNVGVSLVINQIAQTNEAIVDGTNITAATGTVHVAASDDAEILGVAFGVSTALGPTAGLGSVVYNSISDAVIAQIGHEDGTGSSLSEPRVSAVAVAVTAEDGSSIRGATGAVALNVSGGNAVGLSATIDQISNVVVAEVAGATITAQGNLGSNGAPLASPLGADSVLVSAASTAAIETVAIGAAASVGNSGATGAPTPQQNLSTLVSGLQPSAPTQLAGRFGPGAFFVNTVPRTAPPIPPTSGLSGAGSIAVSLESTTVTADVTVGNGPVAALSAGGNVLLLASNVDSISAYAGALSVSVGSGKGVGISVVTNEIGGATSAFVSGSEIDASGAGPAMSLNNKGIDNGVLSPSVDPSASQTPATDPALTDGTASLRGIAVIATSKQTANTVAVVASLSTAAASFGANAEINVMGGTTQAYATSSTLDATASSDIRIAASSASFANNLDIGAAASGSAGAGTVALIVNTMDRTTSAYLDATRVGASGAPAGAVTIAANAWEGTSGEAVGIAASGASGVAGSALANNFSATTTAYQSGGTIHAGALGIAASTTDGDFGAIGTAALGSSAGVGASAMVSLVNNATTASISGASDTLGGPLTVAATTTDKLQSYDIGAAVGGSAGVSAMVAVAVVTDQTLAQVTNSTVTDASTVGVTASETATINATSGGVAAGGSGGVGASVNVAILKSATAALVGDSTIGAVGAVNVTATSTRDVNLITVTAGLGGQAGLAGNVGVVLIGSAASGDELGVIGSGVTSADGATTSNGALTAALGAGADGTSATIQGGSVTAAAIVVEATGTVAVSNIAGALGAGLAGGFGAAIAYTDVDQSVTAKATGGSLQAPALTIAAAAGDDGSGDAAKSLAVAGAGGAYVGLGAAVGVASVANTVTAELGSRVDGGTASGSTVSVGATDTSTAVGDGYGFAGGVAAIGVSVAKAGKSSTVAAELDPGTTVANMGAVVVGATAGGALTTAAIAGGAGVASGAGADAASQDSDTVTASIGAGSSVGAAGGTLVSAEATPKLSASAIGAALGLGVGVGVSTAQATASLAVTADVGDGSTISGGGLTISAIATTPSSGTTASTTTIAGGGGSLLGAAAAVSQSQDSSRVSAYGGKNLTLPSANVTIAAENDSSQSASSTGVAAGYVGVGASVATAQSSATTTAYLDAGATTAAGNTGVLAITASGNDANTANAVAGAGGIVAGAAAVATTSTTATTTATLYGNGSADTLYLGGLNVTALHTTSYAANGDAFQASEVGASGGTATNTVNSSVTAEVGTNLTINSAAGDMDVVAKDTVNQTSGGARAGSGGVAAGAATVSNSTVTQTVAANVDQGTTFSLNDDPSTSTAKINILAMNILNTTDSVSLIAGGLFAGGGAQSNLTATANDSVNIGAGAVLFSAGSIDIGTAAEMTSGNNASASLYGLVTGAGASTSSTLTATQTVNVGASATVEAWGIINLYAGQSGDGEYNSLVSANATTTVYNNAVIPITATYSGSASATDNANLTLAAGSAVLGVNNVYLGAVTGNVNAAGNGTNYNPYLSLFSTEVHDNNRSTSGVGSITLGGTVAAGIHNQELITIGYNGAVSLSNGSSPYGLSLVQVADPSDFTSVVSYRNQALDYAIVPGFNPHQQIVSQLSTLSGLTAAQVSAALASGTQIHAVNDDAAGDGQRLINALVVQSAYAANASGSAVDFGNILVSAGNVYISADKLSGAITNNITPQVSSSGLVKIDIENQGVNFVELSKLTVTGTSGGGIIFTGGATASSVANSGSQGIAFNDGSSSATPTITVNASYAGQINGSGNVQVVDANGNVLSTTPDIYFNGDVTNQNGLVNVNDQLGNVVVASQNFDAGTIQMTVPNGTLTVAAGAGSIYTTSGAVATQFAANEYRPTDPTTAIEAVATSLYQTFLNGYYANNGSYVSESVYGLSDPANTVFAARLTGAHYNGTNSVTSYIFLPTQSNGTTGWVRSQYKGEAYGPDSGPFNCVGCGGFITPIAIQPLSASATGAANAPSLTQQIVGGAIIMSASVLNINSTLESGKSSTYSVNIGAAAAQQIADIKGNATTAAADAGKLIPLTVSTVNAGDTAVAAAYDVSNNQIVVQNVVQGAGGYIYLNGRIISTSDSGASQGNLIVNGGYGTVNIQNMTGTKLVTNTINTGASSNSVIEIVDQNKNQTTWYVYNSASTSSQPVTVLQQSGVNNTSYSNAAVVGSGGSTGLQYDPQANQLYQWVDTANLTRASNANQASNGWVFTGVSASSPVPNYTETTAIISGTQSSNYQESVSATGKYYQNVIQTGSGKCCGADFNGTWTQDIYTSATLTLTNTVKASNPINIVFNAGSASNVTVNSNASVVVNGSITNLNGPTTIDATGAASAILKGTSGFVSGQSLTLSAPGGIGVGAALPIQVTNGTLTASSVDHDINVAAIGPLTLNSVVVGANGGTPQGNVTISATGDINAAASYDVRTPVVVGKTVEIDSSGGAVGATTTPNGLTNINPLVIEAQPTALPSGGLDGGLLNSTTSSGAYIVQSAGDLRLGTIASSGPVFLEAAGTTGAASIVNGLSTGALTASQTAYLTKVWTNLDLLNGADTLAVTSYQSLINAAYSDYFLLRNLAFADGSTYSITPQGTAVLSAQVAAANGVAASAVTGAQVQAAATNRFQRDEYLLGLVSAAQLGVPLDTLFGTTAGQTAQFQQAPQTAALTAALQTYSSNFSYTLPTTSTLYTGLTSGSHWTLDQLTYTVSSSADPASNTPAPSISSLPSNVSGRQIMLYAPSGSIGSLAPAQSFSFTSVDDSSLTAADKALLTSAGPGQLQVTSTALAGGATQYNVTLSEQSLVMVSPLAGVSANAQTQVYLGSTGNLLLGGISPSVFGPVPGAAAQGVQTTAGGNVKLEAVGSILGGVAGQVAVSGNISELTLIAETGSIGAAAPAGTDPASNPNALILALPEPNVGKLDQATASQGIYLRQSTGDLVLGNINGGTGSAGAVQLAATGNIYAEPQFTDRMVPHIIGSSLDLRANEVGFNGSSFQPLQVEVSGPITGAVAGNATILSPAGTMTIGASGQTYATLTSGGTLVLDTTSGGIAINGDVSATDGLQLFATAGVTFAAGSSGAPVVASSSGGPVTIGASTLAMGANSSVEAAGVISVATTGNATLGQLASTLSNAGMAAITVTSGGSSTAGAILSNGDGRDNLVANGAGGQITLSASNGIASAAQPLAVSAAGSLSLASNSGADHVSSVNALHVTTASAAAGSLSIIDAASLQVDNASAATTLDLISTAGAVSLGTVTSGGRQTIEAHGTLSYASLATLGVAGNAAQGIAADPGDIRLTSDTSTITGVPTVASGVTTPDRLEAAGSFVLSAKGSAGAVTATTLKADAGTGTVITSGAVTLTGVTTAGALGVTSTGGAVTLGTATSGGTQVIGAATTAAFTTLTANGGDVDVTAASIGGATVTAKTGAAQLTSTAADAAGVPSIDVATVSTGTGFGATAQQGGILLGSVTSGGTQVIGAATGIAYAMLKTTAGDVDLTSTNGAIAGTGAGNTLKAAGSFDLEGATTIAANGLAADTGTGTVRAGGAVTLTGVTTAGALGVTSTGGAVTLGTATSGGTQTIGAATTAAFTTLTSNGGDVDVTAASIGGATVTAKTGAAQLTSTAADAAGVPSIAVATVSTGTGFGATAQQGSILLGSATSGGTQTIGAAGSIDYTTLKTTTGDIDLTSTTGAVTGMPAGSGQSRVADSLDAGGSFSLRGATTVSAASLAAEAGSGSVVADGAVDVGSTTVATTLGVTSTGARVTLGTATSGGTQTIGAATTAAFSTLTANRGDVDVTAATIGGATVTAKTGAAQLTSTAVDAAGVPSIDVATVSTGTDFGATAQQGGILLGTATSGGTQVVQAAGGVGFGSLTSTAGDIGVNAAAGTIAGGDVTAFGSTTLAAHGDNTGGTATARSGDLSLRSVTGRIDWNGLRAGGSVTVAADAGSVALGTSTSGGSQRVTAQGGIGFAQLTTTGAATDPGNVLLAAATGAVGGGSIDAAGRVSINGVGIAFATIAARAGVTLASTADIGGEAINAGGEIDATAIGTLRLDRLRGASVALATPGSVSVGDATVVSAIDLAATNVAIGQLHQAGGGPLLLDLTGYGGAVGNSAYLSIDAPNGIVMPRLAETTVNIATNASQVTIGDAFLTGTMRLTTATSNLWFNDTDPTPIPGSDVQFFAPSARFYLVQNGNVTLTNSYVVQYGPNAVILEDINGVIVNGASLARDIGRQARVGDAELFTTFDDEDDGPSTPWHFPVAAFDRHLARLKRQVLGPVDGRPAVNLGVDHSGSPEGFKVLFTR